MKGLDIDDCDFCGCACENSTHVFRDCQRDRQLWNNIIPNKLKLNLFNVDIKECIKFNMDHSDHWSRFWDVGCHCLWWWRNIELHDEQVLIPYCHISFVHGRIEEYDKIQINREMLVQT